MRELKVRKANSLQRSEIARVFCVQVRGLLGCQLLLGWSCETAERPRVPYKVAHGEPHGVCKALHVE